MVEGEGGFNLADALAAFYPVEDIVLVKEEHPNHGKSAYEHVEVEEWAGFAENFFGHDVKIGNLSYWNESPTVDDRLLCAKNWTAKAGYRYFPIKITPICTSVKPNCPISPASSNTTR